MPGEDPLDLLPFLEDQLGDATGHSAVFADAA